MIERRHAVRLGGRHRQALADVVERAFADPADAALNGVQRRQEQVAPLLGGSVDLAVAYCVFQHLPSTAALEAYLQEMARVTRGGGLIAFTLTPRTATDAFRPALQLRRWLKERLRPDGPRDLYRREWLGIRPRRGVVRRLGPVVLTQTLLHGDKWLFYGSVGARVAR